MSEVLVARGKPARPDRLVRYIYLNTTCEQMRSYWAICNPRTEFCAGLATPEDKAQMRSVCARSKRPDSPVRLRFIRFANSEEIAERRVKQLGVCNKCGEHKELAVAGRVCIRCGDVLDQQWARSTATDWVLMVPNGKVNEILCALKRELSNTAALPATDRARKVAGFARHVFRDTNYAAMKLRWADAEAADSILLGYVASDEAIRMQSLWTTGPHRSSIPLIRPATFEEITEELPQWQIYRVIEDTFEKWGFDDEGQPIDGIENADTRRRKKGANEEITRRLEQLELLEAFQRIHAH